MEHDSQEFLRFILTGIQEEINEKIPKKHPEPKDAEEA